MTTITKLDAAARAWAVICLADGRLVPLEERRFLSFAVADAALAGVSPTEAAAAWLRAYEAVAQGPDFGRYLPEIASAAAASQDAPPVIMRAAQAALIADRIVTPQETGAIRTLAAALGLDPEAY
jgi:tellurite resistance protein